MRVISMVNYLFSIIGLWSGGEGGLATCKM